MCRSLLLRIAEVIPLVCLAAFSAFYLGIFVKQTGGNIAQCALVAIVAFAIVLSLPCLVKQKARSVLHFLFKWRWLIGIGLFVFLVALNVNGSSVAMWARYTPGVEDTGVIWGTPRGIRTDEWSIALCYNVSQDLLGYPADNELLRATTTNMTLSPVAPSHSLATLFRPFQWGFLLLGAERGTSWFWVGHVIFLFLISVEFFSIFVKKNKWSSICAATIVTFSPYAQWWGCFEIVAFGEMIIVSLYWALNGSKPLTRILFAFLLPYFAGCYLLIAYPAWLVPLFYFFLICGIWIIVKRIQSCREIALKPFSVSAVISFIISLITVAASLCVVFAQAANAIEGTTTTIYPGNVLRTGGGGFETLFDWIPSLFFGINNTGTIVPNACERAAYFSLFPIGLILSFIVIKKKRDGLLIALAALNLAFVFYVAVGIPDLLAKITLLSYCGNNRIMVALGLINLVLLFRSLQILTTDYPRESPTQMSDCALLLISVFASAAICLICRLSFPEFWVKSSLLPLGLMCVPLAYYLLRVLILRKPKANSLLSIVLTTIVFTSGFCVNPIQIGLSDLTQNEVYKAIRNIDEQDPGAIWIAEGEWLDSNLCVAAGAPTLTSTSAYPNLAMWEILDPEKKYEEVYLRYANFLVNVDETETVDNERIRLQQTDLVFLSLTDENLRDLGVRYILADEVHTDTEVVDFVELYRLDDHIIYRLDYLS